MRAVEKHLRSMVSMLESVTYISARTVFRDFVESGAIAFTNVFPSPFRAEREKRFQQIAGRYKECDKDLFARLLAELVCGLEAEPSDLLGRLYMEMDAGNARLGQFFTPSSISELLAAMVCESEAALKKTVAERGFINAHEPACGGGALTIAQALRLGELGINYQKQFHAHVIDLDLIAVHMAVIQFSALHIPATVVHGDALTLVEHSVWYTPAYHMGLFGQKIRRGYAIGSLNDNQAALEPTSIQNPKTPSSSTSHTSLCEA